MENYKDIYQLKYNTPLFIIMLILIVALVLSMFIALTLGTTDISTKKILQLFSDILKGKESSNTPLYDVIILLRMPRIILAVCIGMGLSVCGVVMQAIVRNPLADPYILGISSGASLGATAAILLGIGLSFGENYVGFSAFLGAMIVAFLVLLIGNLGGSSSSVKLLLAGMALNAVCSAFSNFIVYFAGNMEGMQSIAFWMLGSLAGAEWSNLAIIVPITLLIIFFFYTQARIFNLMLLGDEIAITLGRDMRSYRHIYLLLSSLLVGFFVFVAGMIGFIGLIIPHITRMLIGTDHKQLIPISAIVGGIFLLWADILCRSLLPSTELPIGILTSLIGAPCFVYLLAKKTYGFGGDN
ncbi:MAG: iron ABC transporter permease [Deltaproteobacteria bacterium]|jgi:iron complex transport system permease protein|nr:iron ABC transporter permease [Deltaproteobacteria bacterium]